MKFYPVNLQLTDRPVLIFGGGRIALRKAEQLLKVKANLKVISPAFLPQFAIMARAGQLKLVQTEFAPWQITNEFLIIAATDNSAVNAEIAMTAERRKILVNDCSDHSNSTFTNVAVWEKSGLMMTCSTQGHKPARARQFSEFCQEHCESTALFEKKLVQG